MAKSTKARKKQTESLPEGKVYGAEDAFALIKKLATGRKRSTLERWLGELRDRFSGRILGITEPIALEWGRLTARCEQEGQPIPVIDGLLGATAIVHGLSVVTRNTSDIARSGAPIVDPWQAA